MAVTTITDDNHHHNNLDDDDDDTGEHVFPPYQNRSSIKLDLSKRKRSIVRDKSESRIEQAQVHALFDSRNKKDSPLSGAMTVKSFVNTRKSQIIDKSNDSSMNHRITQYKQKLNKISLKPL